MRGSFYPDIIFFSSILYLRWWLVAPCSRESILEGDACSPCVKANGRMGPFILEERWVINKGDDFRPHNGWFDFTAQWRNSLIRYLPKIRSFFFFLFFFILWNIGVVSGKYYTTKNMIMKAFIIYIKGCYFFSLSKVFYFDNPKFSAFWCTLIKSFFVA